MIPLYCGITLFLIKGTEGNVQGGGIFFFLYLFFFPQLSHKISQNLFKWKIILINLKKAG